MYRFLANATEKSDLDSTQYYNSFTVHLQLFKNGIPCSDIVGSAMCDFGIFWSCSFTIEHFWTCYQFMKQGGI